MTWHGWSTPLPVLAPQDYSALSGLVDSQQALRRQRAAEHARGTSAAWTPPGTVPPTALTLPASPVAVANGGYSASAIERELRCAACGTPYGRIMVYAVMASARWEVYCKRSNCKRRTVTGTRLVSTLPEAIPAG